LAEESFLERIAQGKRVIICELDPPKNARAGKVFQRRAGPREGRINDAPFLQYETTVELGEFARGL
jgi:hypothetical protein